MNDVGAAPRKVGTGAMTAKRRAVVGGRRILYTHRSAITLKSE